jgi:hypothetical protein
MDVLHVLRFDRATGASGWGDGLRALLTMCSCSLVEAQQATPGHYPCRQTHLDPLQGYWVQYYMLSGVALSCCLCVLYTYSCCCCSSSSSCMWTGVMAMVAQCWRAMCGLLSNVGMAALCVCS